MGKHHLTHMFSLKFVSKNSAVTAGLEREAESKNWIGKKCLENDSILGDKMCGPQTPGNEP